MAKAKIAQTAHNKKAILLSLEKSLGVVTSACKEAGIPRRTFYNWIETDQEFAAAVADIEEIALDFGESQLHKRIKGGSDTAIIFFLKTKGKRRGYVERIETTAIEPYKIMVADEEDKAIVERLMSRHKN